MQNSQIITSLRYRWTMVFTSLLLLATLVSSPPARGDSQNDMLVFLSLEGFDKSSTSNPAVDGYNNQATLDFLYTYNSDRFRFLAEYIWSSSESEMERLQAAWLVNDKTTLWLGRFHAISNYWTSEYHHGQYLQTSISRPGIEEWEDESGPIPSHITGLWLQRDFSTKDQSGINLGLAIGLAPKFTGEHLAPFDVLDPESGHDLGISGRLVYRPDILSMNQIGLAVAYNDIAVVSASNPNLADLNSIRQGTLGVFANWQWKAWRLSTNWVFFDIDMRYRDGSVKDDFTAGYLQGEYEVVENWTLFGRTEISFGEDSSPYLALLPTFVAHRNMIGGRWDFADSHALTLEVADTSTKGSDLEHENFKELRIQWSAVFP